ncbi:jg27914 [Pararge aegeria aegeria]|uniref:Jg27914 protein n=1 Tax=Pararge aegeria aegeria TaxID=348720 RepID=A0A8S4RRL0_9NEOP|nr:jg27914 [Pararge aegeria aegeria]
MFGRPRCREWTPLTTQQLRLRSLIQIVGYNIRPPEWCRHQCSYYLTLHHTTMSAPFYTSERICSPHPKWKEIDSGCSKFYCIWVACVELLSTTRLMSSFSSVGGLVTLHCNITSAGSPV